MRFSTVAVGLAALLPFAAAVPYATGADAVDAEILQYALTLEHLEAKFYKDALARFSDEDFKANGYSAFVRQRLLQVADHEATHVATLEAVLTAAGQTPTAPCEYTFPYSDVPSFLGLASIIENVGVGAYLYKSQFITNKQYLVAAASILGVEARHQALLTSFTGRDGIPNAFDTPLTGSEVISLAGPFFKSCPESNPMLPFKAFAPLTVTTANPAVGQPVSFTLPEGTQGDVYIFFINGLSRTAVKLVNGQATIPEGFSGTIYAIASSDKDIANDDTSIAGPAIIDIRSADATYADKKVKRAVEFAY